MGGADRSIDTAGRVRNSAAGMRGFTLVELLLALGISALIATLAYAGLGTAIDASASMQNEVRRLAEIQRTLNILEEDLAQVVPRAIVNGLGSDEAAFRGGRFQDVVLEFTRGGVANPRDLARSELQRVRYVFDGGRLWRQWWYVLDRANGSGAPESALLLDGVSRVDVAFLAPAEPNATPVDLQTLASSLALWTNDWSSARIGPDAVSPLPIAVDVQLTLDDFGEVRRVVELP